MPNEGERVSPFYCGLLEEEDDKEINRLAIFRVSL